MSGFHVLVAFVTKPPLVGSGQEVEGQLVKAHNGVAGSHGDVVFVGQRLVERAAVS